MFFKQKRKKKNPDEVIKINSESSIRVEVDHSECDEYLYAFSIISGNGSETITLRAKGDLALMNWLRALAKVIGTSCQPQALIKQLNVLKTRTQQLRMMKAQMQKQMGQIDTRSRAVSLTV